MVATQNPLADEIYPSEIRQKACGLSRRGVSGLPGTKAPVELSYESPLGKSIHSGCPNSFPMKFRAMPLSTTELGLSRDMASYMSLSINQKAMECGHARHILPNGDGSWEVVMDHGVHQHQVPLEVMDKR
ncbi:MAG: hypothetical protein FRX49_13484 [Trebouxia sp. A1-2]|nr:MAG: hypothetical protein FRX49_13484 [Trebouxia sp. A1-2]